MARSKLVARLGAVVLAGLWATGCPQLLDDQFESVPENPDASLGGSGGTGGTDGGGDAGASGDAGAAGDGGDPCASCKPGETCCDGACSNLNNDWHHCGSCEKACPGTVCSTGTCVSNLCAGTNLDCDQNIVNGCEVDAATDPDNCGSCGAACSFDAVCEGGTCQCQPGSADCNGDKDDGCEISTASDPANCGGCGTACGANQECMEGACVCATGFANCNGDADDGCEVNLDSSAAHCGACTKACADNQACASSNCACTTGFLDCTAAPGCETPVTDANNCGACGIQCSGGAPVCNGTACVTSCGIGETLCGASCVDVKTDPGNCGSCGNAVGSNQLCVNGKIACAPGFGDCNSQASDGCETDLTSDKAHCGSCPNACKPGAICSASACQCAAGTPNDCGSECRECCSASDCSDGNLCTTDTCSASGTCSFGASCSGGGKCCAQLGCFECCVKEDCASNQVCSGNLCVLPSCNDPEILCAGVCVNKNTDANNCGGCGNVCGAGRSCAGGQCTPKWVTMAAPQPTFAARKGAAVAYISSLGKVFIWGGTDSSGKVLATGAMYDMATNSWSAVPNADAPTARTLATAVWTGTRVAVWGGGDAAGSLEFNDGARFDPVAGTWTPMSAAGDPPPGARAASGFWTGSKVLIFGGYVGANPKSVLSDVYLYDPQTDTWSKSSPAGRPPRAVHPAVAFTGSVLYLSGGKTDNGAAVDASHAYDVVGGAWSTLVGGPSARYGALGAWDSSGFVVWAGHLLAPQETYNDGQRYDPAGPSWTAMAQSGAPAPRYALQRDTGWAARVSSSTVLFLGGVDDKNAALTNGGIYNATSNTWTGVADWPSKEEHRFGAGVWAGGEFVLWGGTNKGTPTATGERFRP